MAAFTDIAEKAEAERASHQPIKPAAPAKTGPQPARRGRPPKMKEAGTTGRAKARLDKHALVGHFSKAMHKAVNRLAFDQDRTMQSLMGEALDDVLVKYGGKPFGER